MRIYVGLIFATVCLWGGCGSGLPSSSSLLPTIDPPSPALAVGASVALTGNATGFTQTPLPQPTPGTYHVQFIATQFSTFDHVSATATAPVTVTP
jgi:hypothetical protein